MSCANERLIPVKEVVEVPGPIRWREIPPELLIPCDKQEIPDNMTYGDGIKAWGRDRASIDACNGKLAGIESLGDDT